MIYEGKPLKFVPSPKICIDQPITGQLRPNTFLAKQPAGDSYKIRFVNDERQIRAEWLRRRNENFTKNEIRQAVQNNIINMADKKYVYNQIKQMVNCEMKANEHLFIEECSKPEIKLEEEHKNVSTSEDLVKKMKMLKEKRDEEERKLVKEKRLQLFIQNSDEIRFNEKSKRRKEIDIMNYKFIQEKERDIKEQNIKRRELANYKNLEIISKQNLEKEEENRKCLEKKHQFLKDLSEQVQQKELIRLHEKQLKQMEYNDFKKLFEEFDKEEKNKKLIKIENQIRKKEEIGHFEEENKKLLSKMDDLEKMVGVEFLNTMKKSVNDDIEKEIETKNQIKLENEIFMKNYKIIKEENKIKNEEKMKLVLKQMNDIEDIKESIKRESDEARRIRIENIHVTLKEQIKSREIYLKQQKDMKHKINEELTKENEEFLRVKQKIADEKKEYKSFLRNYLNEQMKFKKDKIEQEKKSELEYYQNLKLELKERQNLVNQYETTKNNFNFKCNRN